ncbi:unnamed protein product [Durusdinium trenchii]|uniref:Uncharacterized protein n=1 Tax=Durusdinium trenchii TaxID=1381693 RepID=A0ABP0MAW2_9DINO
MTKNCEFVSSTSRCPISMNNTRSSGKKCHFQGESLHLEVSVGGDPAASLDCASLTLANEFRAWTTSPATVDFISFWKLCGLKACLNLSKVGAVSASMVKAEVLHGIAFQGIVAAVGGVYVAGTVATGGGLAAIGSTTGLAGELAAGLGLEVVALEAACQAAALELLAAESAMAAATTIVAEVAAAEVAIAAVEPGLACLTVGLSYLLMPVRCALLGRKLLQLKEAYEANKKEREVQKKCKQDMQMYLEAWKKYLADFEKYVKALYIQDCA